MCVMDRHIDDLTYWNLKADFKRQLHCVITMKIPMLCVEVYLVCHTGDKVLLNGTAGTFEKIEE